MLVGKSMSETETDGFLVQGAWLWTLGKFGSK